MKKIVADKLEHGRVRQGPMASDSSYGLTGAFLVTGPMGVELNIVASVGDAEFPWEHVSVSTGWRTPNWAEMCFAKKLFWRDQECVVQYHPPESDYVNHHPFCLHLFRPTNAEIPMPPSILVGPKGKSA